MVVTEGWQRGQGADTEVTQKAQPLMDLCFLAVAPTGSLHRLVSSPWSWCVLVKVFSGALCNGHLDPDSADLCFPHWTGAASLLITPTLKRPGSDRSRSNSSTSCSAGGIWRARHPRSSSLLLTFTLLTSRSSRWGFAQDSKFNWTQMHLLSNQVET